MVASGVFYDAARSNLLSSVCLACAVMFYVTLNWAVTLIATVSLVAVIAGVLATMAVAGWKVNIIESIDISIAGGMAVDYILHLAHAFNHQESFLTGEGRVRGALGEMGVSVLSGALTTLSATCALFCCQLLWFRNFGIFIALLVIWSIVVSMMPMMALFCYVPGDSFGQVDFTRFKPKWLCNKSCARATPEEATVAK
jgi:predicted RND superfamily exporter protein